MRAMDSAVGVSAHFCLTKSGKDCKGAVVQKDEWAKPLTDL